MQPAEYKFPRVDKQARGRTTPQLIPEYEQVWSVVAHDTPGIDSKRCLVNPCKHVPAGSRLLVLSNMEELGCLSGPVQDRPLRTAKHLGSHFPSAQALATF